MRYSLTMLKDAVEALVFPRTRNIPLPVAPARLFSLRRTRGYPPCQTTCIPISAQLSVAL
jgi:hypothetical protein